jgi:hypothetical protein
VGGDGLFSAVVDIEAGVFPGEEIGKFGGADEFGVAEGLEEAVAEEFDGGSEVLIRPLHQRAHPAGFGFASVQNASDPSALFNGHAVEAAIGREESVGSEEVEVGVENEVVVPTMVNDLPKGRGAGTTGLVDGGHKEC